MSTPQRIYCGSNIVAGEDAHTTPCFTRLVRAANAAQALRHVAVDTLRVAVASQDDLVKLLQAGVTVEDSRLPAVEDTTVEEPAA